MFFYFIPQKSIYLFNLNKKDHYRYGILNKNKINDSSRLNLFKIEIWKSPIDLNHIIVHQYLLMLFSVSPSGSLLSFLDYF